MYEVCRIFNSSEKNFNKAFNKSYFHAIQVIARYVYIAAQATRESNRLTLTFHFRSPCRPDERHLQEVLPAGPLQEDRRRRSYVAK